MDQTDTFDSFWIIDLPTTTPQIENNTKKQIELDYNKVVDFIFWVSDSKIQTKEHLEEDDFSKAADYKPKEEKQVQKKS